MRQKTIKARIIETSYKNTSVYGNPSHWVTFEDANGTIKEGYTAANAACGYGCTNFIGKAAEITYHVTRGGSLVIDYIK